MVLTGRIKDIIIRKGENVAAKEIEDLLYQHPKVAEVAVIGLPDKERGELRVRGRADGRRARNRSPSSRCRRTCATRA